MEEKINDNEITPNQEYKEAVEQLKRLILMIGSLLLAVPLGCLGILALYAVIYMVIINAVVPEIQAWIKLFVLTLISITAIVAAIYLVRSYRKYFHLFYDKGTEIAFRNCRNYRKP